MSDNIQFSEREKEVTELLLQGNSNKQIALALGISTSTVEYHLNNIYRKLQVSSRTEAVLRLGKSIGGSAASELGKSTVEMNGETADNGVRAISTRRIPMNKMFAIIGAGLVVIALVVLLVLVNWPLQSAEVPPTNVSSPLPDLAITSAYVSMVDSTGRCLPYYGFNVTVINQGSAPAPDVTLAETSTGQEVHIGTLNPLQSISMPFIAQAASGAYTVVADPHNSIVESNESNNSVTSSGATATPVASCLPLQFGAGTDAPISSPTMTLTPSATVSVIDTLRPTDIILSPSELASLPDLIIKFMYLEMEGRQANCVEAYARYGISVSVENIGPVSAGPFEVDLNGTRQQVDGGLAAGQFIALFFVGTVPSGRYEASADSMNQIVEREENNNTLTFLAPTPTPPLLCTPTPTPSP